MENLNETIQFLIQSLQTYTGNNPIWILYPVALILIWFLGKKGDRKLFIGVFVTECLTIFNPFVVKVLLDVFGFGTRFVRFLWIIVFFITIGYALTLLIFASAKTGVRILTGGICLVLIVTLGIPVFRGTEEPRILRDGLLLVYRQYDPDVRSYVSRRILQKIEKTSEEKFMKEKKIKDWMKKIVAVYYYHDYSLPAEEFQSLVRGSKVDYIISATPELDEYLSGTTMYVLGQTENYRVWKVV